MLLCRTNDNKLRRDSVVEARVSLFPGFLTFQLPGNPEMFNFSTFNFKPRIFQLPVYTFFNFKLRIFNLPGIPGFPISREETLVEALHGC